MHGPLILINRKRYTSSSLHRRDNNVRVVWSKWASKQKGGIVKFLHSSRRILKLVLRSPSLNFFSTRSHNWGGTGGGYFSSDSVEIFFWGCCCDGYYLFVSVFFENILNYDVLPLSSLRIISFTYPYDSGGVVLETGVSLRRKVSKE